MNGRRHSPTAFLAKDAGLATGLGLVSVRTWGAAYAGPQRELLHSRRSGCRRTDARTIPQCRPTEVCATAAMAGKWSFFRIHGKYNSIHAILLTVLSKRAMLTKRHASNHSWFNSRPAAWRSICALSENPVFSWLACARQGNCCAGQRQLPIRSLQRRLFHEYCPGSRSGGKHLGVDRCD